jgi:hypothetical protein
MSKTLEAFNINDKVHRMVELISFNEPYVTVIGHDSLGEYNVMSILKDLGCGKPVSIGDVDSLSQISRDQRIDLLLEDRTPSNFLVIRVERFGDKIYDLSNKVRQISEEARSKDMHVILLSRINTTPSFDDNIWSRETVVESFTGGSQTLYSADLAVVCTKNKIKIVKNRFGNEEFL